METVIKGKGRVVASGQSCYLLLDKIVKDQLQILPGMILGYKLWNILVKVIKCPKCKHEFEEEENKDPHDCPACNESFLDVNSQEVDNVKGGEERDE